LVVTAVAALQFALVAPAAHAGLCAFDSDTHTITVGWSGTLTISRSAQNVTLNGDPCHTVTTVDQINVNLEGTGQVVFDLSHGLLAPGFTDEEPGQDPDSSEIEIDVANPGPTAHVVVVGSSEGDALTAGSRTITGSEKVLVFNFNGGDELFSEDEDATVHGTIARIEITGNGDGDLLSGAGTAVTGAKPVTVPMTISDGPGSDNAVGGNGADVFVPGLAISDSDSYFGKNGKDSLSYAGRTLAMVITEDDNFNDGVHCPGATCEGDNIGKDVEKVVGGSGGDTITGSGSANTLNGAGGRDHLNGGNGNDFLNGGPANDTLNGGSGTDTCKQGPGTGTLTSCEA
jgi:Ca2+-binding RTX toxin-like protein